jgi:hypothetical protein
MGRTDAVMTMSMMIGPAVIALLAAGGAVRLFTKLEHVKSVGAQILMWCGIVICSLIAFGIGTCYAMVFA